MKVRPTELAGPEATAGKPRDKEPQGQLRFDAALAEATHGREAPAAKAGEINFQGSSYPVSAGFYPEPLTGRTDTLNRAEGLLDLLEDYSSKLCNPACSLKDLHLLVIRMEDEKNRLLPGLETLSDRDGSRDFLNRLLVTTSVEIIKFNRGDYL